MYSFLGSIPKFDITFNYVTWFGVIYLIASYIRIYPSPYFENKLLWSMITIASIILSILSVFAFLYIGKGYYFLLVTQTKYLRLL